MKLVSFIPAFNISHIVDVRHLLATLRRWSSEWRGALSCILKRPHTKLNGQIGVSNSRLWFIIFNDVINSGYQFVPICPISPSSLPTLRTSNSTRPTIRHSIYPALEIITNSSSRSCYCYEPSTPAGTPYTGLPNPQDTPYYLPHCCTCPPLDSAAS